MTKLLKRDNTSTLRNLRKRYFTYTKQYFGVATMGCKTFIIENNKQISKKICMQNWSFTLEKCAKQFSLCIT